MAYAFPQKIIHIELSADLPNLLPTDHYPVFYLVFWWHRIPLGDLQISAQQLPLCDRQLKQLAVQTIASAVAAYLQTGGLPAIPNFNESSDFDADAVLQQWEKPFLAWQQQQMMAAAVTLSVVICTRDRPHYIQKCLKSLQHLSDPANEIIVVDNAPTSDATQQLVAQFPAVKYVLEPKAGLDFARNAGISHSSCELIAYTDDDVSLHPDWTLHLRQAFQSPNVMAVTGLVIAAEIDTQSQYIFERYWSFNRGYRRLLYDRHFFKKYSLIGAPAWRVGAGASMAFRRDVFEKIGDFDERLDVGAAGCSGDSEMWYRVLAAGFDCLYEPTVVAYHTHRSEMAALHHQLFHYMRGHVSELLIRFERYRHWGNLVRLVLLPAYFLYLLLFGWRLGSYRYCTLFTEISGCLSGFKFFFKAVLKLPLDQ